MLKDTVPQRTGMDHVAVALAAGRARFGARGTQCVPPFKGPLILGEAMSYQEGSSQMLVALAFGVSRPFLVVVIVVVSGDVTWMIS